MNRLTVLVASALAAAPGARAGDLYPPPGRVAPTVKTLDAVEPRIAVQSLPGDATSVHVISAPGSYYLTADIAGAPGMNGVRIASDRVTLDLMGFSLVGVPGSLNGVTAAGEMITVHNGFFRAWGSRGLEAATVAGGRFERLTVEGNAGKGLAAGTACAVIACLAVDNGDDGIFTNSGCLVAQCVANSNDQDGFDISVGCEVVDCVATSNAVSGLFGIQAIALRNFVARSNGSHGAQVGEGSDVSGAVLRQNGGDGVRAAASCTVSGCTATNNAGDGVRVSSNCRVAQNHCAANGTGGDGAGVHATGTRNVIDANTLVNNSPRGLDVDNAPNTITRNAATGSATNYDIAAGNDAAPITTAALMTSPVGNVEN